MILLQPFRSYGNFGNRRIRVMFIAGARIQTSYKVLWRNAVLDVDERYLIPARFQSGISRQFMSLFRAEQNSVRRDKKLPEREYFGGEWLAEVKEYVPVKYHPGVEKV